ncbi:hypothetical protein B7P43_G12445 [Cryptotermes secundus]|uniref:Uncharacterized protein n=1 Tax=Cryptotermes secundus TaxID=105785 RepID=A0A2J7PBY1_9NEOP|nr:hypothetical protein B7P43_G12445 [Cryptotermes secundus]
MEDKLRQMHGEDGLEDAGLKFDHDSIADVTPNEANKMMQETSATNHITEHEEEALFTYEVCPLNFSYFCLHASVMCRFVAFSRLPANRTGRLIADKGVVFAESLIPAVFFREMKLKLPAGVPTQPLQSLQQVSAYLHKIHRLAFCTGTGLHDPIRSMKCRIYVDMPSSVRRCTACSTQRQAVLFAAQQKAT